MKKIILNSVVMISSFMTLNASARDLIRPEGAYAFSEVKTAQIRDVEVVPTQNSSRYYELVADKFQCQLLGNFYKCQKHIKDAALPESLKKEMESNWKNMKFTFVRSTLSPAIINDAESLMEWKVFDQVTFGQEEVGEYDHYMLLGEHEINKMVFRFNSAPVWANVDDMNSLYMPVQRRIASGQFKTRIYELSLTFRR